MQTTLGEVGESSVVARRNVTLTINDDDFINDDNDGSDMYSSDEEINNENYDSDDDVVHIYCSSDDFD